MSGEGHRTRQRQDHRDLTSVADARGRQEVVQHERAFARCRRALVRRTAHADDGVAAGERGQDLAQSVRPRDRVELVGALQAGGGREVVVGTQRHHQAIAVVRAGIGRHAPRRRVDGLDGLPQHAHARLHEVAVRQAHRVQHGAAEHHVELRIAEDERIAAVDQRYLNLVAEGLRQDRAQLQSAEAGPQDRDPCEHGVPFPGRWSPARPARRPDGSLRAYLIVGDSVAQQGRPSMRGTVRP